MRFKGLLEVPLGFSNMQICNRVLHKKNLDFLILMYCCFFSLNESLVGHFHLRFQVIKLSGESTETNKNPHISNLLVSCKHMHRSL